MGDATINTSRPDREASAKAMVADLESGEVDVVLTGMADINGVFRAKRIPASRFVKNPYADQHFSDLIFALDIADNILDRPAGYQGYWPDWTTGWGDVQGIPDPTTYRRVPWLEGTALVLLDLQTYEGKPLVQAPRTWLNRVIERVPADLTPIMAAEFEFTVFKETADELEKRSYRDMEPLGSIMSTYGAARGTADESVIEPIRHALSGLGIEPEASNPEAGFGQYEVNTPPASELVAADNAFLFKHAVREVVNSLGHTATFMSRPSLESFGSSLHIHQSIWSSDGKNLFVDSSAEDGFSTLGRQFLAGQLATLSDFTAIFAPTINAYKRLVDESAAGTTRTWAVQSRSVGLRLCNETDSSTRVEHRTPGADANPYLVFAAALAGGIWGIEQELDPGQPYDGNAYVDDAVERIPGSLDEAIDRFEQSEVANDFFGEEAVAYFSATRRAEIEQHAAAVTDWEIARYFARV